MRSAAKRQWNWPTASARKTSAAPRLAAGDAKDWQAGNGRRDGIALQRITPKLAFERQRLEGGPDARHQEPS